MTTMGSEISRCRTLIADAVAGLDDERAAVRVEGRWSIAEIVEHLDRTYSGTTKGLERCLDAGATRVTGQSLRTRARRFVVVTVGYFPTGVDAPRHVLPSGAVTLSEVVERAGAHLQEMEGMLARAAERFGNGLVMDHPILGPFTAAHWARFHAVHTRHHCRQIVERRGRLHA
jgi:hypothetical protein